MSSCCDNYWCPYTLPQAGRLAQWNSGELHPGFVIRHTILMPPVIYCITCSSKLCALHSFCIMYNCAQTSLNKIVTPSEPFAVSLLHSGRPFAVSLLSECPLVSLETSHFLYVSICVLLNVPELETIFQKLAPFIARTQNIGQIGRAHV